LINFYNYKRIHRLAQLCIFVLISALPLYSNAKDPDFGLSAQPSVLSLSSLSSPTLHLLLQKVTADHPQVKSQIQSLLAAGMDRKITQQAYWPTPSITMERAQTQGPDPAYMGSSQVLTFRLQQPLWTGGRLTAQSDKARITQAIEHARLIEIQQSLALKTLQAWADVVMAQRQQQVLQKSEAVQTQLLQKITRRAEQGLSPLNEVNYANLRLVQVRQDRLTALQQENQAWIRLTQWVPEAKDLGQALFNPDQKMGAADGLAMAHALNRQTLPHWEAISLANSPLILRLEHGAQLQLAELAEKRAALQPEVYVRAEHQRGSYTYANMPNSNRVFVGLSASTGAGLGLAYQLAALQNKHDGALEEIVAARRSVLEAIQTEFVNANARQSKAEMLLLNLESSQEIQAAWERQFINGKKSWIDVMNAARETSQAELAVIENEMAWLQSLGRLHIQAYGTPAAYAESSP
jgi:adhesin transport system outer membrane protein